MSDAVNRKVVPVWVALCLALFSAGAVTFAVAQLATITFNKPYVVKIAFNNPQLKVESARLDAYNVTSNRYGSIVVQLKNYYTSGQTSGTVYVSLFDADGKIVASGSAVSVAVPAGETRSVSVLLTWQTGKTMGNVGSGRISVES